MKEIDDLIEKAINIGLKEVERIARKELTNNKKLHKFTMAMGRYFFTNKKNEIQYNYECKELNDFISEYNDDLGLTGNPMCFTAKGQIVTDW